MIKVLIVDDSAMVRKILQKEISKDKNIEVIGTAPDPFIGRDKIVNLKPDVLILDIEMPRMDGLTFLQRLMKYKPIPVIIVSSLVRDCTDIMNKAIEYGAAEVISKPGPSYTIGDMSEQLIEKIKAVYIMNASGKNPADYNVKKSSGNKKALIKTTNKIIAIGASTGGTQAVKSVLADLPAYMPPIAIVQHMPENFTKSFAKSLNDSCLLEVKEAEDNELLSAGKVLIAPGNKHMTIKRSGAVYYVQIKHGPLVHHQRPSVEVLFNSVAEYAGSNAIGVIMTGMGKDGAEGLLNMKMSGAFTIAQDKKSSVVYGMPKEAKHIGAVMREVSLKKIPEAILQHIS